MAIYWGKIAAHSAYEMFSWYKYLIVSLVFSHLGFWSGSLFLIAPFPDLCLLVSFVCQGASAKVCRRKPPNVLVAVEEISDILAPFQVVML